MTGPGPNTHHPSEQVGWSLATAAVNRVVSVTPIFFGRLAGDVHTETFDVKQGVESCWRVLGRGDLPQPETLRVELLRQMAQFRQTAAESAINGSSAVVAALDAIAVLFDDAIGARERMSRALTAALGVAIEFDVLMAAPPSGYPNWMTFELRGQAKLCAAVPITSDDLPDRAVFDLRTTSGAESMHYRHGMSTVLGKVPV